MHYQRAFAGPAVMQTAGSTGVKTHSPAFTYVADREMSDTNVEGGKQVFQE